MKVIAWALLAGIVLAGLIVLVVQIVWIGILAFVIVVLAGLIWLMLSRLRGGGDG